LSIVIDTSPAGPVVHQVAAGSPLEGLLFPGDAIVAVNGVDTRSMSAKGITELISQTSDEERQLTVVGPRPSKIARDVVVPAGPMGIILDATADGPVVDQVKDDSPLKELIFPGDAVWAVNGTETRSMSVRELTDLMAQTADQERMIKVYGAPLMVERTFTAPPGPLGILIDTTEEGPMVDEIKPDSALKGMVMPGDVVVAINEIDTHHMTARRVSEVMVETSGAERTFTVMRPPPTVADPSAAVGATATSAAVTATAATRKKEKTTRMVVAPAGKLGLVIDTTKEGPTVHQINDGSPLEGDVFPGDVIVAIDGVDTRTMSARGVTALMAYSADEERKFTILGKVPPAEEGGEEAGGTA
jgi:C-terminal processing protease CtpA/Prc